MTMNEVVSRPAKLTPYQMDVIDLINRRADLTRRLSKIDKRIIALMKIMKPSINKDGSLSIREAVVMVLKERGPMRVSQILSEVNGLVSFNSDDPLSSLRASVSVMAKDGLIDRVGKGLYSDTNEPEDGHQTTSEPS